ncbi:porin [Paraburkholderia mimosarum]|uniref:porin n=1 Tax=Paraburkholderia mimosarum TaxID=312026 RepID=UPI0004141D6A|nr:porin [Paraburkholderia mimosarum]
MRHTQIATAVGGIALALACQSSFAQSSVTLYGIVDTSIRYLTNANANNDSQVQMGVGPITGSRWGMKGSEDLGGGLKAVFRLENGFNLWNGQLASSNTLFNRMAYVGVSSDKYGTVTMGRQNTPLFDQLGNTFDPLTVGNFDQDGWLPGALGYGLRQNNSVKYDGTFGGLQIEGMYSFGGVPGSVGANSMYGFTTTYSAGPVQLLAGYQQNDLNSAKYRVANLGAVYAIGPVHLYGGWLWGQDNTGMLDFAFMPATNSVASNVFTGPKTNNNRIDNALYAGATWQVTSPLQLTAAYYYDHAKNGRNADNTFSTGVRYSAVLLAEYSLSKRTEVYGTVDFMRGTGSATVDFPGRNNQTGVAVGLRNIF